MTQEAEGRRWVSSGNLAKRFGVRPVTIRAWAKRAGAEIRAMNQRLHLVDESALLAYIEKGETK